MVGQGEQAIPKVGRPELLGPREMEAIMALIPQEVGVQQGRIMQQLQQLALMVGANREEALAAVQQRQGILVPLAAKVG